MRIETYNTTEDMKQIFLPLSKSPKNTIVKYKLNKQSVNFASPNGFLYLNSDGTADFLEKNLMFTTEDIFMISGNNYDNHTFTLLNNYDSGKLVMDISDSHIINNGHVFLFANQCAYKFMDTVLYQEPNFQRLAIKKFIASYHGFDACYSKGEITGKEIIQPQELRSWFNEKDSDITRRRIIELSDLIPSNSLTP